MDEIKLQSVKLLSWQPDCAETFMKLGRGETLVICSQRQVGKSLTCSQLLLYVALNYDRSKSFYISPTNDSSRKFFNDMKEMLEGTQLVTKVNESLLIIEFINGSSIYFRSAESKLRGYSCRNGGILVVDEAQYLPDDIWKVILPFTNVENSRKVIISTPGLKTTMFWKFYQSALLKEPGFHLISTKDYDTSMFLSDEQREAYKKMLTPQDYRSEILGEWLDVSEGLFGDYQSVLKEPTDWKPVVVGIDWSNNGGDNTVISGFNSKNEQCLLEFVTAIKDPSERAAKVADIINANPTIKTVVAEKNSIGEVYISILKKLLKKPSILKVFTTTNDSKKKIIDGLIAAISQKSITLLPNEQLQYELSVYKLEPLKNGNYTYNGPKDDAIMSTAFALSETGKKGYCFGYVGYNWLK